MFCGNKMLPLPFYNGACPVRTYIHSYIYINIIHTRALHIIHTSYITRYTQTKTLAKARDRSLQGAGATGCLRARPTDSPRVIPATEFVGIGRCFMGIEEHVAVRCPCCDATDVDTRHARICPRAGAQVKQHQPLLHAMSRTLKRLGIPHQVESEEPFIADRISGWTSWLGEEVLEALQTWKTGTGLF